MEFNENLNIIVGENEAGKSTILEAIKLVLNQQYRTSDKSILAELFNRENIDIFIKNPSIKTLPSIQINIQLELDPKHKNSEFLEPIYHFTNGINIAPKKRIAEWHYNYGPNPYKLMVNKREAADIDDIYDYVQALAMLNMPTNINDLNDIDKIQNMFKNDRAR